MDGDDENGGNGGNDVLTCRLHGSASDNGSFGLPSDSASMPTGVGHSARHHRIGTQPQ